MSRKFRPDLSQLIAVAVASLCICLPSFDHMAYGQQGETPEQVRERMEIYRQREAERERLRQERIERDRRKAEEDKKKREEEEASKWMPYGNISVYWVGWKQVKDGSWVTEYNDVKDSPETKVSTGALLMGQGQGSQQQEWGGGNGAIPEPRTPLTPTPPSAAAPTLVSPPATPAPLRPDPSQLRQAAAPLRYGIDHSIEQLVRDGVVTPAERDRLQVALKSLDVGSHLEACRIGSLSVQECINGILFLGSGRQRSRKASPTESKNYIAVNCKSLTINKTDEGTGEEQLVIDLCSSHR